MTRLRWEWGVSVGVWVTYSNVNVSGDIGEIGIIWHHADLIIRTAKSQPASSHGIGFGGASCCRHSDRPVVGELAVLGHRG